MGEIAIKHRLHKLVPVHAGVIVQHRGARLIGTRGVHQSPALGVRAGKTGALWLQDLWDGRGYVAAVPD